MGTGQVLPVMESQRSQRSADTSKCSIKGSETAKNGSYGHIRSNTAAGLFLTCLKML